MVDVKETRIILRRRKLVADIVMLGQQQEQDIDVSICWAKYIFETSFTPFPLQI